MIADSAAGYAANTLTAADTEVLTVEYKLNLLAPAEGQLLIAEGSVIRYGRTLIVTRAEVFAVSHGRKNLCALMQQTIMAVHGKHPAKT
jgi:acyl-coenzyme A thioesterase PaaI-like protein